MSIQLDANGNYQKCCVEPLINQWKRSTDFLVINPAFSRNKNKYIYAAATLGSRQTLPHFPFDTVVKLNFLNQSVHTWSVGHQRFISEPIFIPKGQGDEEDDGYLLVAEVSNVLIIYLINKTA